MATPPTFSTGAVLTAAQMNAVGLWRVGGASFAGATTFDVSGFSSDYTQYKLIIRSRRVDTAGAGTLLAQVRNGSTPITTGYYQGSASFSYTGAVGSLYTRNNGSNFIFNASDSFIAQSQLSYDIASIAGNGFTFQGTGYFTGAAYSFANGGAVYTATAIDNIRCSFDYGTHTGLWELYGFKE